MNIYLMRSQAISREYIFWVNPDGEWQLTIEDYLIDKSYQGMMAYLRQENVTFHIHDYEFEYIENEDLLENIDGVVFFSENAYHVLKEHLVDEVSEYIPVQFICKERPYKFYAPVVKRELDLFDNEYSNSVKGRLPKPVYISNPPFFRICRHGFTLHASQNLVDIAEANQLKIKFIKCRQEPFQRIWN